MTTQLSSWGYFANGTVHIICSSHNDIAWFDTPAATIAWKDVMHPLGWAVGGLTLVGLGLNYLVARANAVKEK